MWKSSIAIFEESDDHPWEDLTKFDYKPYMKI
jgi:hypothetical protein